LTCADAILGTHSDPHDRRARRPLGLEVAHIPGRLARAQDGPAQQFLGVLGPTVAASKMTSLALATERSASCQELRCVSGLNIARVGERVAWPLFFAVAADLAECGSGAVEPAACDLVDTSWRSMIHAGRNEWSIR